MNTASRGLLKEYVQSPHFTSTAEIMAAMKEMLRDVIQTVMEVEMEQWLFFRHTLPIFLKAIPHNSPERIAP